MNILYSEHPSMFRNHPIYFIFCLLMIAAAGLGLILLLIWYLQTKASKLEINEHEILFEQGLLSKSRAEISLASVRTIKVHQSFFDRIFGVGTLELYTAGDDPEIRATGLPDPNKVREIIKMGQQDH